MSTLRLADLLNEMSKIDAIYADTVHTVKTFDKPSDSNLLTLKVINKLKEKRNASKNSVNKSMLIQLISKLEKDYKSGKMIKEDGLYRTPTASLSKSDQSKREIEEWLKTPVGKKATQLMGTLITAYNNYMKFGRKHTKGWNTLTQAEKNEHDALRKAADNSERNEMAFRKKYILPASKELGVSWSHLQDAAEEASGVKWLK